MGATKTKYVKPYFPDSIGDKECETVLVATNIVLLVLFLLDATSQITPSTL
jgi:hypothetical protein